MSGLAELGVRLRREDPGEHRTACPQCADGKARKSDDALAVKVEPDGGATWCCHRCGWKGAVGAPGAERRPLHQRPPARSKAPQLTPADFPDVAARLWSARRPIEPGTTAAHYLEGRGCALPPADSDLAWHPEAFHPDAGRTFPALLALVTNALTGAAMTVHRTFLAPDGSGKAAVDKPRLLVKGGDKAGGVVRLWPDEEVATGLCVGEGIETCLTAALGFVPVWACLDAGNLAELPVLPGVEALTIVADHDRPNRKTGKRAGLVAADVCARRWVAAGREVRVWKAPVEGVDLNDLVRGAA